MVYARLLIMIRMVTWFTRHPSRLSFLANTKLIKTNGLSTSKLTRCPNPANGARAKPGPAWVVQVWAAAAVWVAVCAEEAVAAVAAAVAAERGVQHPELICPTMNAPNY